MEAFAQSLAGSPQLFPLSLDVRSDIVQFIRLGQADYRHASFLDDRVLTPQTVRRAIPWSEVDQAVQLSALPERCYYIFHIGHVGSTLLSRLIGEQPGAFSLREPAILRTFAQIHTAAGSAQTLWKPDECARRLATLSKLLSRTFAPTDKPIVKATSFVSELAVELMARPHLPKAILMFVSPETYLATILGGANAPREAEALGPARFKRLQNRLGAETGVLADLSVGEVVAMSWACEMTALANTKTAAGDRAILLNFDAFLDEPPAMLARSFDHLGVPASSAEVHAILDGPEMRSYSKAPEHAYDPSLRRCFESSTRSERG